MRFDDYEAMIQDAYDGDDAWSAVTRAEDDTDLTLAEVDKLSDLYDSLWSREDDEDFELADFCRGGALTED